jgi:hypothetical protein
MQVSMPFEWQQTTRTSRHNVKTPELHKRHGTGENRNGVNGEAGENLPGSESRASLHRMSSVPGRAGNLCGTPQTQYGGTRPNKVKEAKRVTGSLSSS